jgi:uncharacterized membrane protein
MIMMYLYSFLIYSFIGWLWETPFVSVKEGHYINRGFLRGPYIPIYGVGCTIALFLMHMFQIPIENDMFLIVVQIIVMSLISSLLEYATSWMLEKLFMERWWDYSHKKYNLNGRVSLDYAILFGLGGYLLLRFVQPVIESSFVIMSQKTELFYLLLILILIITTIDLIVTILELIKIKKVTLILRNMVLNADGILLNQIKELYFEIRNNSNNIGTKINSIMNINSLSESSFKKSLVGLRNIIGNIPKLFRFYKKFPVKLNNLHYLRNDISSFINKDKKK